MKLLILKTEDWQSMDTAIEKAGEYLKDCNVVFDSKDIKFDVSLEGLYNTVSVWDWLKVTKIKSINPVFIKAIGDGNKGSVEYDGYVLFCSKEKALEDTNLYGEHTIYQGKHIIEVYGEEKPRGKFWGFDRNTYSLIHETIHALDGDYKKFHNYLKVNKKLDDYKRQFVKTNEIDIKDMLPLIKRQSEKFLNIASILGFNLRITSGFRSIEEQNKLYNKKPKVTNAKGGESLHNWGCAFDIVDRQRGYDLKDKEWKLLSLIWKLITDNKGEWGGDWKSFIDKPHFQNTLGYNIEDFQKGNVDINKFN